MQLQHMHIENESWIWIEIKCLVSGLITIRENKDVCAEHYRCSTVLYLLSVLSKPFNITIDCGISSPLHGRDFLEGLNAKYRGLIFHLMATVKVPISEQFDTQILAYF